MLLAYHIMCSLNLHGGPPEGKRKASPDSIWWNRFLINESLSKSRYFLWQYCILELMVRCGACMFVLFLVSLSEGHLESPQCFKCFETFFFEGKDMMQMGSFEIVISFSVMVLHLHNLSFLSSPHLCPVCHGKRDTKVCFLKWNWEHVFLLKRVVYMYFQNRHEQQPKLYTGI